MTVADSEYADYAAIVLKDRVETDIGVLNVVSHLDRFGMEVHRGDRRTPDKKSKSEYRISDIELGNDFFQ